ncbi:hypothetical protein IHE44_0007268 [Lamprotornis superbus]|uniref:Uncharacterized protein n=1 Tax=Lamprotornis superbus TaxID=245042 RepID=A0A835TXY0_9PASS|nr:hypothetical protein IHE44_0007268 [Lamprotornis superbus]
MWGWGGTSCPRGSAMRLNQESSRKTRDGNSSCSSNSMSQERSQQLSPRLLCTTHKPKAEGTPALGMLSLRRDSVVCEATAAPRSLSFQPLVFLGGWNWPEATSHLWPSPRDSLRAGTQHW